MNNSLCATDQEIDLNSNDNESNEYVPPDDDSRYYAFSEKYITSFEKLCKKYGKYFQHQSDRNLPRTHFNTTYTACTRKNGHEMAGLLLVFLTIFLTNEGEVLDKQMNTDRCGAYIHVLELLLMLESLCKQDDIMKNDVHWIRDGMPYVMETIKTVINRQEGCGMKIIKFHLMIHYAEDILRFGSMKNFDSSIGERHHVSLIKEPAKRTQRRKGVFELQTANRYCEKIAIHKAISELDSCIQNLDNIAFTSIKNKTDDKTKIENKHMNLYYDHKQNAIIKNDSVTKKHIRYHSNDESFIQNLCELCSKLVSSGSLKSNIQFFTQHNRDNVIFRANGAWKNETWYDWANIKWDVGEIIPAQLLIFLDITESFIKPFQIGQCHITEPGVYAIGRTFQSQDFVVAHQQSKFVKYGEFIVSPLTNLPELCMFPVDAIHSPCIAVPYDCSKDTTNSVEWLLFESKDKWYNLFLDIIQTHIE